MDNYNKWIEEAKKHPCCNNCGHCFREYGQDSCWYEGEGVPADSENWNTEKDVCDKWECGI